MKKAIKLPHLIFLGIIFQPFFLAQASPPRSLILPFQEALPIQKNVHTDANLPLYFAHQFPANYQSVKSPDQTKTVAALLQNYTLTNPRQRNTFTQQIKRFCAPHPEKSKAPPSPWRYITFGYWHDFWNIRIYSIFLWDCQSQALFPANVFLYHNSDHTLFAQLEKTVRRLMLTTQSNNTLTVSMNTLHLVNETESFTNESLQQLNKSIKGAILSHLQYHAIPLALNQLTPYLSKGAKPHHRFLIAGHVSYTASQISLYLTITDQLSQRSVSLSTEGNLSTLVETLENLYRQIEFKLWALWGLTTREGGLSVSIWPQQISVQGIQNLGPVMAGVEIGYVWGDQLAFISGMGGLRFWTDGGLNVDFQVAPTLGYLWQTEKQSLFIGGKCDLPVTFHHGSWTYFLLPSFGYLWKLKTPLSVGDRLISQEIMMASGALGLRFPF